jgi:hypothetical protein
MVDGNARIAICPACHCPVGFDWHRTPESMVEKLAEHEKECMYLQALMLLMKRNS